MYTPEGYWSWDEICIAAFEWTEDLAIATKFPDVITHFANKRPWNVQQILCKKLVEDGFAESAEESRFALEICELWILANFLDTFDVIVCSPAGTTMRCPPAITAHGDALDWWVWPLSHPKFGNAESHGYLEFYRKGHFRVADARKRFCAIDYLSGRIKLKPNSVRLFWGSSHGHGPSEEEARTFIEDQVRPFVGWSICVNPKDLPDTRAELFSALGFGDVDWEAFGVDQSTDAEKANRHRNVLECVLSAYPNGKDKATWEAVEREVGYSRRSIVRALKQNDLWLDWAKGGQIQLD